MPRGKAKSIDEKLAEIREAISVAEINLKQLKADEKALIKTKEDIDIKKVLEFMKVKGLSPEEILSKLEK